MFRTLLAFAAVALFAAAPAVADDEKKTDDKKPGRLGARAAKVDKAKVFELMDADKDGKLTKDEFRAGMDKVIERMKEKGGERAEKAAGALEKLGDTLGQKAFEKLDADKDGSISKEEYEKGEFDPTNLKGLREKFGKGKEDK
jgi:polyhydroxyalkanoate synthesis regulator phasin